MENKLHVSSSPHVRSVLSTKQIMRDVCIALLPTTLFGAASFGLHALLVVLVCIIACVLSEYAWQKLMHRKVTVSDYSAAVTGLLLALNMPPDIPLWIPVLGSAFAIIVIKQLYGGLGQNFMNPAMGARCFLLLSFTAPMSQFSHNRLLPDAVSGPTALQLLANGEEIDLMSNFLGLTSGCIGEVSKLCILIGVAYLIYRKVVTPNLPILYIASFALFVFLFGGFDLRFTLANVLSGGLILGACFMANDYVTSPVTPLGAAVYSVLLGVLTAIFRLWGANPEGVSYAIIIGNIFTPLIDRVTAPVVFGKERAKK